MSGIPSKLFGIRTGKREAEDRDAKDRVVERRLRYRDGFFSPQAKLTLTILYLENERTSEKFPAMKIASTVNGESWSDWMLMLDLHHRDPSLKLHRIVSEEEEKKDCPEFSAYTLEDVDPHECTKLAFYMDSEDTQIEHTRTEYSGRRLSQAERDGVVDLAEVDTDISQGLPLRDGALDLRWGWLGVGGPMQIDKFMHLLNSVIAELLKKDPRIEGPEIMALVRRFLRGSSRSKVLPNMDNYSSRRYLIFRESIEACWSYRALVDEAVFRKKFVLEHIEDDSDIDDIYLICMDADREYDKYLDFKQGIVEAGEALFKKKFVLEQIEDECPGVMRGLYVERAGKEYENKIAPFLHEEFFSIYFKRRNSSIETFIDTFKRQNPQAAAELERERDSLTQSENENPIGEHYPMNIMQKQE